MTEKQLGAFRKWLAGLFSEDEAMRKRIALLEAEREQLRSENRVQKQEITRLCDAIDRFLNSKGGLDHMAAVRNLHMIRKGGN